MKSRTKATPKTKRRNTTHIVIASTTNAARRETGPAYCTGYLLTSVLRLHRRVFERRWCVRSGLGVTPDEFVGEPTDDLIERYDLTSHDVHGRTGELLCALLDNLRNTRSVGERLDVDAVHQMVHIDPVHQMVHIDAVEQFVDVHPIHQFINVHPAEELVDINTLHQFIDVHSVEEFVDVDALHEGVDIDLLDDLLRIDDVDDRSCRL